MRLKRFINDLPIASIFIELVLTFIGVLAALAVDNLRESRADNAREQEYLQAFREALKSDTAIINSELERCFLKMEAAKKMMQCVKGKDTLSDEEMEEITQSILMLINPNYNTAIYEDLKATGNSRIIRNVKLRNDIIEHYTFLSGLSALQKGDIVEISYNTQFMDQFDFDEFLDPSAIKADEIIDRVRKSKEAQLYLTRLQKRMIIYRNSLFYSALPRTLSLLEKVDAEFR